MHIVLLICGLLLALVALAAEAGIKAGPNMAGPGHHRLKVPSGEALDGFPAATAAYSFRKLRSAYTGGAMRIQRASDNAFLTVGFAGFVPGLGSPFDVAAANTFCNATTCLIDTWYDQSAGARDAVRSGATASLIFNCKGSYPCARSTTNTEYLITPSLATAAKAALGVVANRSSGAGYCVFATRNSVGVGSNAAANTWQVSDNAGGGNFSYPATDAAWHAVVVNVDAASSVARVDSTETTGTVTSAPGSGPIQVAQGAYVAPSQCNVVEAIVWDNATLSPTERAALTANQKSFWGTP